MLKITNVLIGLALVTAAACSQHENTAAEPTANTSSEATPTEKKTTAMAGKVGELEVSMVSALVAKSEAIVCDANGEQVRKQEGVVPGAKLLTSYSDFDPKAVFGTDTSKKLVFYCYNEHCGASHKAAKVAMAAGFSDVNVMTAGIVGWKQAGNKVDTVQ